MIDGAKGKTFQRLLAVQAEGAAAAETEAPATPPPPDPDRRTADPTQAILQSLQRIRGAFQGILAALARIVDLLDSASGAPGAEDGADGPERSAGVRPPDPPSERPKSSPDGEPARSPHDGVQDDDALTAKLRALRRDRIVTPYGSPRVGPGSPSAHNGHGLGAEAGGLGDRSSMPSTSLARLFPIRAHETGRADEASRPGDSSPPAGFRTFQPVFSLTPADLQDKTAPEHGAAEDTSVAARRRLTAWQSAPVGHNGLRTGDRTPQFDQEPERSEASMPRGPQSDDVQSPSVRRSPVDFWWLATGFGAERPKSPMSRVQSDRGDANPTAGFAPSMLGPAIMPVDKSRTTPFAWSAHSAGGGPHDEPQPNSPAASQMSANAEAVHEREDNGPTTPNTPSGSSDDLQPTSTDNTEDPIEELRHVGAVLHGVVDLYCDISASTGNAMLAASGGGGSSARRSHAR